MADNNSSNSVAIVAIFLLLIVALVVVYFVVIRHNVENPSSQTSVIETVTAPVKEIKENTTTVTEPAKSE